MRCHCTLMISLASCPFVWLNWNSLICRAPRRFGIQPGGPFQRPHGAKRPRSDHAHQDGAAGDASLLHALSAKTSRLCDSTAALLLLSQALLQAGIAADCGRAGVQPHLSVLLCGSCACRNAETRIVFAARAQVARLRPQDVGFVSVHGTGTPLGDPIEVGALGQGLAMPRGQATRVTLGAY